MSGAGDQSEALTRVVDQLCAELGCAQVEGPSGSRRGGDGVDLLGADDEALVTAVRQGLERVAAAAGEARGADRVADTVQAALDGAEMVVRGELVCGSAARVATLLPSFVFLVTLPIVEQDRALELSLRTAELVEKAQGR